MNYNLKTGPGGLEKRILLYFTMVRKGCKNFVEKCDYFPYHCGYSEASDNPINTYEVCLFATGKIRCPGEIEKYFTDKRGKSSYRSVLRSLSRLEKKGFIKREESIYDPKNPNGKWLLTYRLINKGIEDQLSISLPD